MDHAEDRELRILYEDDVLLAVDKPSGLAVHRGWARDDDVLTDRVRSHTGDGVVHPLGRLDRATSGVVLFARSPEAARALLASLEDSAAFKAYLVLVRGLPPAGGTIDHPIPRRPGGPRVPAVTRFRLLASAATEPRRVSLLEARPLTGRLHQIRRHLKHLHHPVIGDANHGRPDLNRALRDRYGLGRLALHAGLVVLPHPATGRLLRILAPLPPDLAGPLARMGLPSSLPAEWSEEHQDSG